jgi:hypothetical protein
MEKKSDYDRPLTPLAAFERCVLAACSGMMSQKNKKPGEVVARQSPEARTALQQLTAEDINGVREDCIVGWITPPTLWERIARRR